jgi:hypothetical protein
MSSKMRTSGRSLFSALRRREMVLASGMAVLSMEGKAQVAALKATRTFLLWEAPTHSGGHLQDVDFSVDRFYYLRKSVIEKGYTVGCRSANGTSLWSKFLPGRQYTSLRVRHAAGSVILHRIGGGLEEYNTLSRELTRTINVWKESGFQAILGSSLIGARPDGTVEVLDVESNVVVQAQHKLSMPLVPSAASLSVEKINDEEVLILNRHTAGGVKLRIKNGIQTRFQCMAPEISTALAKYAVHHKRAVAETGNEIPLNALTLPATGHDAAGRVYALVAPYRLKSALILVLDSVGQPANRISCVLPDRTQPEYGSPARIFLAGQEMYLVYSGGGVVVYQMS